ncbi:threonine ammonia-lyase [Amycolatopsis sp. CA-230715]|uniref:threonine ammonia-lyase n=1 Tax=Amycolatopsis sp. CA-230715 TaxID=2745196 RepID=UPI001C02D2EA|nr:pyridoxal-phosphate dependent enzyme [Amycolatopsis sp. CA-230715]QWF78477.1 L-threo-3-hydroxyaspartate ammonia-lyase [Amycolatopsis sp. CA-230715]
MQSSQVTVAGIARAAETIDPVFLDSPQYLAEPLEEVTGARVVVKVETANPVRCFKGRGADFRLASTEPGSTVVCASAGNFGQGIAYAARERGVTAVVFVSAAVTDSKLARMRQLGADVRLVDGDFDGAKFAGSSFAEAEGHQFIEDGRDPAVSEGAGTIGLELARWPSPFDVVVLPLGNGALAAGVGRWVKAHSPETEIIAVSAAGAPAMHRSWHSGRVEHTDTVDTISEGVAVRLPIPEALRDMADVVDDVVLADDPATLRAMRALLASTGLVTEPAGALGLAAMLTDPGRFAGKLVATVLTGSNLPSARAADWLWGKD